ncbi:hypothetical protein [Cronobacter sakazakii]|uniref:hypothetical protein n=1 Tax=Cronobacter sakazakii TaxID=28141 RepID=UPI000A1F0F2D|nr:unnamed protein product [Cronobacter sakazakii]AZP33999.1 hypothetical protein DC438_13030 [Cronobacter sakazakii]ELY2665664.1 hypothetical protein [Cronobacter sakazakii]ELY2744154.1 hypothetical protein [Cronobacter sakazakii]ELY4372111.1 hypothetical protein [Cronobacter sakazakii]PQY70173.1 hypothetical protein C5974_07840 [Cronobacter sakazakii]
MMNLGVWIKSIAIFLVCLMFSSTDKQVYSLLEQAAAGVIGSILGGITAGISVIFGILAVINKGENSTDFTNYLESLESDLKLLVFCLAATIFLPYLRNYDLPLLNYPKHDLIPTKAKLFTSVELFAIVVSLNLIIEVISCMILVVKKSFKRETT